jgi:hypothetical protein
MSFGPRQDGPDVPWRNGMKGFVDDIEELTKANQDFRRVLYTG